MMRAREIGDGFERCFIVSQQLGHCGFGPKEQISLLGQRRLREPDQLAKANIISAGIPNERLRNARLNESDFQKSCGSSILTQLVESKNKQA